MSDLTNDGAYLSSTPRVPSGFDIELDLTNGGSDSNRIEIRATGGNTEICEAVNRQGGYDDEVLASESAVTSTFGCFEDTGDHVFVWK